ncbi:hypothetical protein ACLOJK_030790 [Asimina triloba]
MLLPKVQAARRDRYYHDRTAEFLQDVTEEGAVVGLLLAMTLLPICRGGLHGQLIEEDGIGVTDLKRRNSTSFVSVTESDRRRKRSA